MIHNYDIPNPRREFLEKKDLLKEFCRFQLENNYEEFQAQTKFILLKRLDDEYLDWLNQLARVVKQGDKHDIEIKKRT